MVKEMHVTVEKKRTLAAWQHSICCNTEEDLTFLISAFFFSPLNVFSNFMFSRNCVLLTVAVQQQELSPQFQKNKTNAIAETSVSVDLTDAAEIT